MFYNLFGFSLFKKKIIVFFFIRSIIDNVAFQIGKRNTEKVRLIR